ncbi:MAG TPA: TIGR02757 family protein [Thermoanaerobaculia bacterium]|nr:TIGR02757 family protein [Thermoanaerobaculia bacterium]
MSNLVARQRPLTPRERTLAARLDELSRGYAAAIDQRDPIRFAASFERPEDREVAAWIASAFAYGRVDTILATVGRLLAALEPSPAETLDRISDYRRFAREELAGFRHRFHSAQDAAALLYAIARARAEAGSVRAFFEREYRPDERDVGGMLSRAVDRIVRFDWRPATGCRALPADSPVRFFFPSPSSGSACKRWNLYLRWMVRKDAMDFGLWGAIPTSRLVIPTDTHVHCVARRLGLTRRKAADWKTAREITDRLARLDPEDPVRYDYALCELGTIGICRPVLAASLCVECPLNSACPAGRRRLTRAA